MDVPRLTHVRLNVRNLVKAIAWWSRVSPDADVVESLYDTPYGSRKFTIRDPDGNELGFVRT